MTPRFFRKSFYDTVLEFVSVTVTATVLPVLPLLFQPTLLPRCRRHRRRRRFQQRHTAPAPLLQHYITPQYVSPSCTIVGP